MKVEILSHTSHPEKTIAMAGKLCYSPSNISDLGDKLTEAEIMRFINMLTEMGHESPLEHVSFTFGIEGVSRIVEQQLTRHRIASYSIQSGRYVDRSNAVFSMPSSIKNNGDLFGMVDAHYQDSVALYQQLSEKLIQVKLDIYNKKMGTSFTCDEFKLENKKLFNKWKKEAIEDARYVFPNSLQTKIICTMNIRTLINFFHHRLCTRSQAEIRQLAQLMLKECKAVSPTLFSNVGASCVKGYCPEGAMCCGIAPTLEELLAVYKEHKNK